MASCGWEREAVKGGGRVMKVKGEGASVVLWGGNS